MNTDLNNEEYPRLTPPDVVYEHKAALKKPLVIPLYAKIITAAAAVALLLGIFWHPTRPVMEMIADLKPVKKLSIEMASPEPQIKRKACLMVPKTIMTSSTEANEGPALSERTELPMLAELQPKSAVLPSSEESQSFAMLSDPTENMAYSEPFEEDDDELSMVAQGIQKLTEGQCESFFDMVGQGWRKAKTELAMVKEQTFSLPLQKIRDYDFELHHMER